ncbi:hypothetical protein HELRODRAFT_86099 [Helobdella robusta]|uniref:RING-type domain-containing protein n=1 Tax=Helobdella robusta TaxID=6412 RepID=T1G672_HELRO|nr:hypothetical protein HELRODRAFT_86099 [Helobdella robusta]ESN96969.1 hypothetical protein HELRODRAFT_86099 [Helobdella robusta]
MFLNEECPICLERFEESCFVCELFCRHTYHLNCLEEWLHERPACPLCQKEIKISLESSYDYEEEMMGDGRLKVTINLVTNASSN